MPEILSLAEKQQFLTEKQVAALTGVAPETLRYWRYSGGGPPFCKFNRLVRYPKADLKAWLEAHRIEPNKVAQVTPGKSDAA